MRFILALCLAVSPLASMAENDHSDHVSHLDGLRALHAWTRATDDDHALLFVELENKGDQAVTLTGGESDIAASAQLVGFRMTDGQGGYAPIPMVPIAPGAELVLAPEALALHLDGLARSLVEGDSFEAELEFDAGHLVIHVEVEAENARQHGHAGHAH